MMKTRSAASSFTEWITSVLTKHPQWTWLYVVAVVGGALALQMYAALWMHHIWLRLTFLPPITYTQVLVLDLLIGMFTVKAPPTAGVDVVSYVLTLLCIFPLFDVIAWLVL